MKFNTALLHGDFQGEPNTGATTTPIYQSSAFAHESAEKLEKIFHNQAPGYSYTRISNPTVDAFEKRVTALEGGVASVACASGMAALYNAFCNILRSGDEIVSSASLYGGSIDLFRDLEAFGITTHYVENNDLAAFEAKTNEHTRLYFAETIGNPRLDVTDITALANLAHEHQIPLIIDNTVATAFLVKPLSLGADIVMNSSSKYINGHSNSISGIITDSGRFKWDVEKYPGMADFKKFGPFAYTAKLRNGLFRNTGPRVRTVTACQGSEICPSGCIDTYSLAKKLDEHYFGRELPHKFKFGVTGCQNNCLKAEENDIGVKGGMEVSWVADKCINCGVCEKACREDAIKCTGTEVTIDYDKCTNCGRCVKSCPTDAWEGKSGYIVSFGGLFGNHIYKGEQLLPLITDEETLFRVTDAAIGFFEEHANPGERFRLLLQRVGEDEFRKVIRNAFEEK